MSAWLLMVGVAGGGWYLLRTVLGGGRTTGSGAGAVSQTWITEQRVRDEQYP